MDTCGKVEDKTGKKSRTRSSVDQVPNFMGGLIVKWFRELSVIYLNAKLSKSSPSFPIDRQNPVYHSESKANKKKKRKDYRRYSFNDRQVNPPPAPRRRQF
ncbi:uncharacterized protein LOC135267897 [Tribolium castaneum]|uniref:uncharacterized protein LOC135267897 n=1 Tax=Tribolium castaneum TaxID=7070 RepID=UPI0030FEF065